MLWALLLLRLSQVYAQAPDNTDSAGRSGGQVPTFEPSQHRVSSSLSSGSGALLSVVP